MADVVEMELDSNKKHSVRYNAVEGSSGALTSVYLMKTSETLTDGTPSHIKVTVEKSNGEAD